MFDLQEEISKLQNYELFVAFEEIKRFRKTGILIDGHVRNYSTKMAEKHVEDYGQFIRLVEDTFLFEMSNRFYEGMKI